MRCLTMTIRSSSDDSGNEKLALFLFVACNSEYECLDDMLFVKLCWNLFCDEMFRNDGDGSELYDSANVVCPEFVTSKMKSMSDSCSSDTYEVTSLISLEEKTSMLAHSEKHVKSRIIINGRCLFIKRILLQI